MISAITGCPNVLIHRLIAMAGSSDHVTDSRPYRISSANQALLRSTSPNETRRLDSTQTPSKMSDAK